MYDKKKKLNQVSGAPVGLKCSKCGGVMRPQPAQPKVQVCVGCGAKASTLRLT